MKIRVLSPALRDIAAARRFYDRQGEEVGDYFFDSIFADVDSLGLYAGIHPVHFGYRRLLARRFPYAIYYRIAGDEVVVYRILDCRRDPARFRKALK
jgi:plasmid stabilization system protein ParE